MSADKKFVYSVTLNEPVAVELRRFDSKGKLSRGITRAQELLSLPHVLEYALAVESNQVEAFYARFYSGLYKTAVRPPAMPSEPPAHRPSPPIDADLDRIEQEAFAKSQAAYNAGGPLPDHIELMGDLMPVRKRVLERCQAAFGWRYGPVPPGMVLPTDDVFGEDPPAPKVRQDAPGDAGGSEGTEPEPPPDDTLSKAYRAIGEQSAQGPMDQGTTGNAPENDAPGLPGEPQF